MAVMASQPTPQRIPAIKPSFNMNKNYSIFVLSMDWECVYVKIIYIYISVSIYASIKKTVISKLLMYRTSSYQNPILK